MNVLRRLTYRRELRGLTRLLGLSRVLSKCYYHWACPRNGILQLGAGGITGKFQIHTCEELRFLEAMALYERPVLDLVIGAAKPGDAVYDIGANVGLYAVLLAKAVGQQGQVIAFEPESASYDRLQDNLKLNGLANVRSFRKALGDCSSEAKLYLGDVGNLSLLPPDARGMSYEVVELVRGDSFREAENLPLPRAVKIDVEGYEYAVLRGLRDTLAQPACEFVSCEIHPTLLPTEVKPEVVLTFIKSLGFGRIKLYPGWHVFHAVAAKGDATTQ